MFDDHDDMLMGQETRERAMEGRLTEFLYLLIRNNLPSGVVVELVREVEKTGDKETVFSAKDMARYSRELAKRILGRALTAEHEWSRHTLDPGASTCLESCWRCGTFRTSDGGMPQDGYEYFKPGQPPKKHLGQLQGLPEAPPCEVR